MQKSFLIDPAFWADAGERAAKTVAQTAAVLVGTELVGFTDLDWLRVASVAGVAGVVSLLTSIASGTRTGTPSFSQAAPHDDTLRA